MRRVERTTRLTCLIPRLVLFLLDLQPSTSQILESTITEEFDLFDRSMIPKRWFDDEMLCHCKDNVQCDPEFGHCPDNLCGSDEAFNWRGPVCQIGWEFGADFENGRVLTDGDPSTCQGDDPPREYSYTGVAGSAYWIHLVRDSPGPINPKIQYGSSLNDVLRLYYLTYQLDDNSTLYKVRKNQLTDDKVKTTRFSISGLPDGLCTLDIGSGWNLAPLGNASMSATSTTSTPGLVNPNPAAMANDGIFKQDVPGACVNIKASSKSPWWMLTFPYPVTFNFIRIFNSKANDNEMNHLRGFDLELYSVTEGEDDMVLVDRRRSSSTGPKGTGQAVYDFSNFSNTIVGSVLKIVINPSYFDNDETVPDEFWLCEVAVFGYFKCPRNKFGPGCSYYCYECIDKICDASFGCIEGCSDPLKRGKYCSICRHGRHGEYCELYCPEGCSPEGCLKDNGTCIECDATRYGFPDCKETCGNCTNSTCHSWTGRCLFGCRPGYYGDLCLTKVGPENSEVADNSISAFMAVIYVTVPAAIVITICVAAKRKRDFQEDTRNDGERTRPPSAATDGLDKAVYSTSLPSFLKEDNDEEDGNTRVEGGTTAGTAASTVGRSGLSSAVTVNSSVHSRRAPPE